MNSRPASLAEQAAAVLVVARRECIKGVKMRQAEAELLLTHLLAAAETFNDLADKARRDLPAQARGGES
jgi:hypothetical protein